MPNLEPLEKFKSKSGKEIEIWLPTLDRVDALLEFINRLTAEDTFLSFTGEPKTLIEEEHWIKSAISNIRSGRSFAVWAIFDGKIVGFADVNRGGTRDFHVGKIGLMVDKDYRREGIGKFLLEFILKKSKQMNIKIAVLDIFGDNEVGLSLYKKLGFKEYARLPKGFHRQKKYSDAIGMYRNLEI